MGVASTSSRDDRITFAVTWYKSCSHLLADSSCYLIRFGPEFLNQIITTLAVYKANS